MVLKLFKIAEKGLDYLALFLAGISALAAFAITALICISVGMRKLFNAPIGETEELVGLLLSVTLFCALPLVTSRGTHIRVTILENWLNAQGKKLLAVGAATVTIGFYAWMLIEAEAWLAFAIRLGLKSEASAIPLVPWMTIVPVSLALVGLIALVKFVTGLFEPVAQLEES